MTYRPGQRVVCVDARGLRTLSEGEVYAVERLGNRCGCFPDHLQLVGVRSSEAGQCNGCGAHSGLDASFRPHRFRPVDDLAEQLERIGREMEPVEDPPQPTPGDDRTDLAYARARLGRGCVDGGPPP